MSTLIEEAVEALNARLSGTVEGCARFVFEGEGAVILDASGARAASDSDAAAADVTLTASPETFVAIFEGNLAPTTAFITGRLRVEGDMALALRLGSVLG
jgi:putative sterol carrier protein